MFVLEKIMKHRLLALIPISTFLLIFICTQYFSYTIPIGRVFHSTLFQSLLAILSCICYFIVKNKRSLNKKITKREMILLAHCVVFLVLENIPFSDLRVGIIAGILSIIPFIRIINISSTTEPYYQLTITPENEFLLNFLLIGFHFIIVYFLTYQILKIFTNDKQKSVI